ncbi:MAG TPA: VanW family protein [Chthonomonadaceae bacterium]|nr:VanW family protein [Chthonomonadaceae bacterium]
MKDAENRLPNRPSSAVFWCKASLLKVRRGLQNAVGGIRRHPQAEATDYPFVAAESVTPLWIEEQLAELPLQRGKVQNLRSALRRLNGAAIPTGGVFSFWKQIGKATRGRGYVAGRQLREGCLFPAIGGGLCQLSNALYEIALQAGCEIVERHPHTARVPGSAAAQGRDATVAWNYLDLRFRAPFPFLIEARLTADTLIVRLRTRDAIVHSEAKPAERRPGSIALLPLAPARKSVADEAHSCATCGMDACFRHREFFAGFKERAPEPARSEAKRSAGGGITAYLVDEKGPEFAAYLAQAHCPEDRLCLPLDGKRWKLPRYTWETAGYAYVGDAALPTLLRSLQSRRLGRYGAARLQAQLAGAEALAQRLAQHLTAEVTYLCVAQSLLPFMWREGHLGGRRFEVLMSRLPLQTLHRRLDAALEAHPERRTLGEFRAPDWLVAAETEALAEAERLVTPHTEIAGLFSGRAHRLDWHLPAQGKIAPGTAIAFPGPTAARKGAYELRAVARTLDREVALCGCELEGEAFWEGVATHRVRREEGRNWLDGVAVVVQPALVEDNPRPLLKALAAGVPVIATTACGLGNLPGVLTVPYGEEEALRAALNAVLTPCREGNPDGAFSARLNAMPGTGSPLYRSGGATETPVSGEA